MVAGPGPDRTEAASGCQGLAYYVGARQGGNRGKRDTTIHHVRSTERTEEACRVRFDTKRIVRKRSSSRPRRSIAAQTDCCPDRPHLYMLCSISIAISHSHIHTCPILLCMHRIVGQATPQGQRITAQPFGFLLLVFLGKQQDFCNVRPFKEGLIIRSTRAYSVVMSP